MIKVKYFGFIFVKTAYFAHFYCGWCSSIFWIHLLILFHVISPTSHPTLRLTKQTFKINVTAALFSPSSFCIWLFPYYHFAADHTVAYL